MGFWGAPDFLALSQDAAGVVRGVRMRQRGRELHIVRVANAINPDPAVAAAEVLNKLGSSRSSWFLLGLNLDSGEYFQAEMPNVPPREMFDALRFEAPREVMGLPDDFRLQFVKRSSPDADDTVKVECYLFANSALLKLGQMTETWRRKLDCFVYPLLALPAELPDDACVWLPELEKDFYRRSGVWRGFDDETTPEKCNRELLEILKRDCRWDDSAGEAQWAEFLTPIVLARFGLLRLFSEPKILAGINVLPDYLRPARYRTQLRIMAILLIALIMLGGLRFSGSWIRNYREYSAAQSELAVIKERTIRAQKKLKSGEKEWKELTRLAELKIGDRDCMQYLGLISEKLPDDVLVSSLRWSEGSIDLVLQTESTEIDLVSFFNRLTGFKVASAMQRTGNNGLTFATVKLTVGESGGKK